MHFPYRLWNRCAIGLVFAAYRLMLLYIIHEVTICKKRKRLSYMLRSTNIDVNRLEPLNFEARD